MVSSPPRFGLLAAVSILLLLPSVAHALENGVGLKPPLGWSTWCAEGSCGNDYCDETMVKEGAEVLMSSGMHALGFEYIVLDDCWVSSRGSDGVLQWDTTKFPSGMPNLTAHLHSMGLKFGLYTSLGNVTCNSHGEGHPTPGSENFYQKDADTFASWGLDYVKGDWCGDVHHDPFKGPGDYKSFSLANNHTTPPRPMFLEGVAAYPFLLKSVPAYYNSWRVFTDHHDVWSSTSDTIAAQQVLGIPGTPGAWSYMDILTIGGQGCKRGSLAHCPGQSDIEYQTEFTMWSLTQSPLFVATDIRNMTAIMKSALLNKDILEIHQDTRTPPGKHIGGWWCKQGPLTCQLWARLLADGSYAAALYNAGDDTHGITLSFDSNLGWSTTTTASVYNLWTQQTSNATGTFTANVPAHGVVYVRLTKQS